MIDFHHRIPHKGYAKNLQVRNRRKPFVRQDNFHQRLCQCCHCHHNRKNQVTRHAHIFQEHAAQPGHIILITALNGIDRTNNNIREVGGRKLRQCVGTVEEPQLGSRKALSYNQGIAVDIKSVQQVGQHQFGTEREKYTKRLP